MLFFHVFQYEFVERPFKRKRGEEGESSNKFEKVAKKRFNTTIRCSLKEVALCVALLKERHLNVLHIADLVHIKDFKIKSNINRRLACFLMYNIDPRTMILDLGGNKVLEINADVIEKLFALPNGDDSPPRPSEVYGAALVKLKDELRIPRNKDIKTDELRNILSQLVDDPLRDGLALKVFGMILYNKFFCPGYSLRVKKEATMVEDFDIVKLKNMQICQLIVDELRLAIEAWQKAGADWRALPGCVIAPVLAYLGCLDHRSINRKDKRHPRAIYMDPRKLMKLSNLDILKKGGPDARSWIFGKLPVSSLVPSFVVQFF